MAVTPSSRRRIKAQPCYVLHSYEYSESSLILEVWAQQLGRLAVIAKGARKPLSGFRAVLLPLQPLLLDLSLPQSASGASVDSAHSSELAVLKAAHWGGGAPMVGGDALLAGLYMNELLLRIFAREDPLPALYAVYHHCVQAVAQSVSGSTVDGAGAGRYALQMWVRLFELCLLAEAGYLPDLQIRAASGDENTVADSGEQTSAPRYAPLALEMDAVYELRFGRGLVRSAAEPASALLGGIPGAQWLALGQFMQTWQRTRALPELSALQPILGSRRLREQLRLYIEQLLLTGVYEPEGGSRRLRSRQFMREVQDLHGPK